MAECAHDRNKTCDTPTDRATTSTNHRSEEQVCATTSIAPEAPPRPSETERALQAAPREHGGVEPLTQPLCGTRPHARPSTTDREVSFATVSHLRSNPVGSALRWMRMWQGAWQHATLRSTKRRMSLKHPSQRWCKRIHTCRRSDRTAPKNETVLAMPTLVSHKQEGSGRGGERRTMFRMRRTGWLHATLDRPARAQSAPALNLDDLSGTQCD